MATPGTEWMKGGNIDWHSSLADGRSLATEGKLVLIDLFNPG